MKLTLHIPLLAVSFEMAYAKDIVQDDGGRRLHALQEDRFSIPGDLSVAGINGATGSSMMSVDYSLSNFFGWIDGMEQANSPKSKNKSSKASKAGSKAGKRDCRTSKLVASTNAQCPNGFACFQNEDFGNEDETRFNLDLSVEADPTSAVSDTYRAAYKDARCTWTEVITGDSNPFVNSSDIYAFGGWPCANPLPSLVDDMHICAQDFPIDGEGSIVGYAGPLTLWFDDETYFPTVLTGIMV